MTYLALAIALLSLGLHFVPERTSLRIRLKTKPRYVWADYRTLNAKPPATEAKRP